MNKDTSEAMNLTKEMRWEIDLLTKLGVVQK